MQTEPSLESLLPSEVPVRSAPVVGDQRAWLTGLEPELTPLVETVAEVLGEERLRGAGLLPLPAGFLLSVAIPVFNERTTLAEMLRRVQAVPLPKELLLVDDGSTDGTREMLAEFARQPNIRVLYHDRNRGKGAALRTAFAAARGDVVVVQDADLEYDPADYLRLLEPIVNGRAEVVFGSRYLGGRPNNQSPWHRWANRMLTWLSNRFTGARISDMETCYKVFRRSVLYGMELRQDRFGIEPELTAKIARRGHAIVEVPVSYRGRDYAAGKKIRLRDAFQAVYCIVRYGVAD